MPQKGVGILAQKVTKETKVGPDLNGRKNAQKSQKVEFEQEIGTDPNHAIFPQTIFPDPARPHSAPASVSMAYYNNDNILLSSHHHA